MDGVQTGSEVDGPSAEDTEDSVIESFQREIDGFYGASRAVTTLFIHVECLTCRPRCSSVVPYEEEEEEEEEGDAFTFRGNATLSFLTLSRITGLERVLIKTNRKKTIHLLKS